MNPFKYATLGLALAFAIALAVIGDLSQKVDAFRSTTSTAAHVVDKHGRTVTLSAKGALEQIRILGAAVDQARQASADAAKADADHIITVERADARTSQEVSTDVLAKLDRAQAELAASRALAAQRLQQLAQARAAQGSGGAPAVPEDPDATCRAAFAADCDGVLALLAAAERQTAQLAGWQAWWARITANHSQDSSASQ